MPYTAGKIFGSYPEEDGGFSDLTHPIRHVQVELGIWIAGRAVNRRGPLAGGGGSLFFPLGL